jgi:hypothetical protein
MIAVSTATEIKAITPEALEGVVVELIERVLSGSFACRTGFASVEDVDVAVSKDLFAQVKFTMASGSGKSWLAESLRRHAVPLSDLAGERERSVLMLFDVTDSGQLDLVQLLADQAKSEGRLGELIELLAPEHVPSKATVEQARGNAELRVRFLDEFESVSSAELAELVSSRSKNRAALAYNWRSQRRVFSIPVGREQRYPLFQIDLEAGEPKPAVAQVLASLQEAGLEGWQLALWFAGPLASLDDRRPVDLLDTEPELVVNAARAVAAIPQ